MKKLLLSLVLSITLFCSSNAQTKGHAFVAAGVSAGVDKVANENVEIGIQGGHNRIAVIGQSFDTARINRQYLLGVKYTRSIKVLPNFDVLLSLAGKTNVSNVSAYVIEPGAAVDFQLGKGVSFITGISSPVTQTSFKARTTSFSGNAGLKFDL